MANAVARKPSSEQMDLFSVRASEPEKPSPDPRIDNIIGRSQRMLEIFDLIEKVADCDSTILINGETGTGKGLVARAIHTEMLESCFGKDATAYPTPARWAEKTVPFLLKLRPRDNGKPLTAPS